MVDASLDAFRARPRLAILPLLSLAAVGSAYAAVGIAFLHYGLLEAILENDIVRYRRCWA